MNIECISLTFQPRRVSIRDAGPPRSACSAVDRSVKTVQIPVVPQVRKCMQNLGDHHMRIHAPALLLGN